MESSLLSDRDQKIKEWFRGVRLLHLPQERSHGHVQLAVMAYADDLVIAGNAQTVTEFVSVIHEELTLKHVDVLTSEHPVEFVGMQNHHNRLNNRNITMEFSEVHG